MTGEPLRRLLIGCTALAVLALSRSASGTEAIVVGITDPGVDHDGVDLPALIQRIRGELQADGFVMVTLGAGHAETPVAALTRIGHELAAVVAVGVLVSSDGTAITVCAVDETTGRSLMRPLDMSLASFDVLARRVVDLVRATILDVLVDSRRAFAGQTRAPAANRTAAVEAPHPTDRGAWAFGAGVGLLGGFEGVPATIAPVMYLRFAATGTFQIGALAAWLGTQPRLEARTGSGSATIEQGVAMIECIANVWENRWMQAQASLGPALYHVAVNGDGVAPFSGRRSAGDAFALAGGVGVSAQPVSRLEVRVEGRAIVAWPGFAVHFADVEAARIGRPSVLGTVTIGGRI